MQRLHGEWLVILRCDATDVCLSRPASEMERLHGEWLAWTCCDAADVCLVHALVNQVSTWGLAGFHVF